MNNELEYVVEEGGRVRIWDAIPSLAWRKLKKPWKTTAS